METVLRRLCTHTHIEIRVYTEVAVSYILNTNIFVQLILMSYIAKYTEFSASSVIKNTCTKLLGSKYMMPRTLHMSCLPTYVFFFTTGIIYKKNV